MDDMNTHMKTTDIYGKFFLSIMRVPRKELRFLGLATSTFTCCPSHQLIVSTKVFHKLFICIYVYYCVVLFCFVLFFETGFLCIALGVLELTL